MAIAQPVFIFNNAWSWQSQKHVSHLLSFVHGGASTMPSTAIHVIR